MLVRISCIKLALAPIYSATQRLCATNEFLSNRRVISRNQLAAAFYSVAYRSRYGVCLDSTARRLRLHGPGSSHL